MTGEYEVRVRARGIIVLFLRMRRNRRFRAIQYDRLPN